MGFRSGLAGMQARAFATFGEPAIYRPQGQADRPVTVIYRNEGDKIATETGAVVTSRRPLLDIRLSELAPFVPLPNRDVVVLTDRGETWNVMAIDDDDGEGIVTLLLGKPQRFG